MSARRNNDADDINLELFRKKLEKMEENEKPIGEKIGNFLSNFAEELDAFSDDIINRRMGNGAKFYGKRKSAFYGEDDQYRKKNKYIEDP